ncbi:hypothetical protein [Plasmodium yoelii yoelii]|uniref:Uncharacterized protein n=1 Tax=Plasmodium yoelii yoelii TaxID=73239 RepID=Q7RT21_PLAYO|nr:hypothetical protein [Plasmodium yoelii yoelii]
MCLNKENQIHIKNIRNIIMKKRKTYFLNHKVKKHTLLLLVTPMRDSLNDNIFFLNYIIKFISQKTNIKVQS